MLTDKFQVVVASSFPLYLKGQAWNTNGKLDKNNKKLYILNIQGGNMQKKIKTLLFERWKFYLIGYLFGYFYSIIYVGIPNIYYLIPLKLTCILFSLIIGTALYYGSKKMIIFEVMIRLIKYCILTGVLIIIFTILQSYLSNIGIDISLFLGM